MEPRMSKVTFRSSQSGEDTEYVKGFMDKNRIIANVGILQHDNTYRITILVNKILGKDLRDSKNKNKNVTFVDSTADIRKKHHKIVVDLTVKQEGELSEELILMNSERRTIVLRLVGQILEPSQGRAILKKGIHCLHHTTSASPILPRSASPQPSTSSTQDTISEKPGKLNNK